MLRPKQDPRPKTQHRLATMESRAQRDIRYKHRVAMIYGRGWWMPWRHDPRLPYRTHESRAVNQFWGKHLAKMLATFSGSTPGGISYVSATVLSDVLNRSLFIPEIRQYYTCPLGTARGFLSAVPELADIRRCSECGEWRVMDIGEHVCDSCIDAHMHDEDDEEGLDHNGIGEYHDHYLRNRHYGYFRESSTADNPAIGMELEVYCEDPSGLSEALSGYIVENDGSLDAEYGAEIVFPPHTLAKWTAEIPRVCSTLRQLGARAYRAPGGVYGVHLTVHRRHLSPLQEARMALFLTAEENADFVRAIGQRQNVYSAQNSQSNIGALPADLQRVSSLNGLQEPRARVKHRKVAGLTKFSALHFKPELLECRIFQATLKTESLLKHVEFYAALIQWTRPQAATGSRWHHKDFYAWLSGYCHTYPNLCDYLTRPSYTVRQGRGTIANTWHAVALKRAA